jgi:hypothetical protein
MKTRTLAVVLCVTGIGPMPARAQQPATAAVQAPRAATPAPPPAPAPPAQPAAPAPRRPGQPINIRVDLSITDERAGSQPIKRTLSLIVADNMSGSVRSQSEVAGVGAVPLNLDAEPELLPDNKIRLRLAVQYDWPAPIEGGRNTPIERGTVVKTALHDSVALILESGKSIVAAQSADPLGDRHVTVEVTGTVLR